MTEFENMEAIFMSAELGVAASMNFVAILFAYLVAANFVGRELPRLVRVGTSVIYTLFQMIHFNGMVGNMIRADKGSAFMSEHYPDSWATIDGSLPLEGVLFLMGLPMILGWLGSIYYMHFFIKAK